MPRKPDQYSKHSASRAIRFRQFWHMVADNLPNARLYINQQANNLLEFILPKSDVSTHLHRVIRDCYEQSMCHHLDDELAADVIFDVLGEVAHDIETNRNGDLFDIELLEEVAWLLCDRYPGQVELLHRSTVETKAQKSPPVMSFPDYRTRRANTKNL